MAIFSVTNTKDIGIGSLRQAIREANALKGQDTINFDGVFADSIADTITLGGSSLKITDDLDIQGTSAEKLTVSGNNNSRVFDIGSDITVEINGLTIANGSTEDDDSYYGQVYFGQGGGIYNQGTLTLSNSIIKDNFGKNGSGGIGNSGTLTLNNTTISGNRTDRASGSGIGNSGIMTVNYSTISNNGNDGAYGGGIYNNGTLIVNHSNISNNGNRFGGGIYNSGTARVDHSTISDNNASYDGGGIYNSSSGILTVNDSTISANSSSNFYVGGGGGIYNSGNATVSDSTISGNSSAALGGGIFNESTNTQSDRPTITVINSTIDHNSASYYGGGIFNGSSYTLFDLSDGDSQPPRIQYGIVTLNNITISSNSARSGGGIYNYTTLLVQNNTITLNTSYDEYYGPGGAGGIINKSGTAIVKNSIIAGNSDTPISTPTDAIESNDVSGNFTSNGFNLIGNISGSTGFNKSEQLNVPITQVIDLTLQNNGGSVKTHALVTGSPALNAGNNADIPLDTTDLDGDGNTSEPIPYDGRGVGYQRISSSRVDIGAFEEIINHVISGTLNADTIIGTAGNDTIIGYQGADIITGGGGRDAFVYTSITDLGDRITDFQVGEDSIVLVQRDRNKASV